MDQHIDRHERQQRSTSGRSGWRTDPTQDIPIGPDDAGNAVMHGIGLLVAGWRWLVAKFTRA